jgi:hypothetical protein
VLVAHDSGMRPVDPLLGTIGRRRSSGVSATPGRVVFAGSVTNGRIEP